MSVVKRGARIELNGTGQLTLGIVADTHSAPHARGLEYLAARHPAAILHAGDIGVPGVLEQLGTVAPVHAVRGNIDNRTIAPDVLTVELLAGEAVVLRLVLTHIALAGPRIRPDAVRLAKAARAALIVCGHSHVPFLGQEKGLTVFNPGSLGPRRFHLPILFGVLTIGAGGIEFEHVDAESGARWLP